MGLSLRAADYAEVFAHFGISDEGRDDESCYPYSPVFSARLAHRRVVIKRTCGPLAAARSMADWLNGLQAQDVPVVAPLPMPVQNPTVINNMAWVAYPWIDGRPYDGSPPDLAAAGDLLGRIHAATPPERSIPDFIWPDHDVASVEEDITGLQQVLARHAPEIHDAVLAQLAPQLESFMQETLPVIRDADLPLAPVTLDFKANNLVYADDGPVLIDPDNGEHAVRLLDLALAALLFHNDTDAASRLFTEAEWRCFLAAYLRHVELTPVERVLWPVALRYVILEWGVWTLIAADEWGEWVAPGKRSFLIDLARTDENRFQLI